MGLCYIRHKTISAFEKNDSKPIRFWHSAKNLLEQELEPVATIVERVKLKETYVWFRKWRICWPKKKKPKTERTKNTNTISKT